MADDHTNLNEANRRRAREEERYRDEVSRGDHGAHKPGDKFPIEEARERGMASDAGTEAAEEIQQEKPHDSP